MWGRASSVQHGNDRFTARRRVRRRRMFIASCILAAVIVIGVVYALHQSPVRISRVQIFGADQSLAAIAESEMQGSYFGIIPRDSIFFFPASRIRKGIIALHPDIAAVSIFRSGLTGLSIRITDRAAIARWCGLAPTPGVDEYCYLFDASGFIFAADPASEVPRGTATGTPAINSARLYIPLEGNTEEPLRATLSRADRLPAVFDFARQLATFGSPVASILVRDDEVDDVLVSGTRVTYVLGKEQNAFTALTSARKTMNLADGSIEYVDLRFDGKVYLKKGEPLK